MRTRYKQFFTEAQTVLEIPNIPNTLNFWHGGNLNEYDDIIAQKNGRYEFGAGLYLTTHYDTARKYAKGNRKFYLITVKKGVNIHDAFLPMDKITEFVKENVIGNKRKEVMMNIQSHENDGKVKAFLFNNIVINHKAIKSSNTRNLRQFLVDNGIDYDIVHNAFGWHEDMMVLYNMKKIVNVIQVKPTDKIEVFDLK